MDYTTFTMELMEILQELMKEDAEITLEKVPKNNGITLDGMIFRKKDCQISPILYVQDFYELWQKGMSMEQLLPPSQTVALWQPLSPLPLPSIPAPMQPLSALSPSKKSN